MVDYVLSIGCRDIFNILLLLTILLLVTNILAVKYLRDRVDVVNWIHIAFGEVPTVILIIIGLSWMAVEGGDACAPGFVASGGLLGIGLAGIRAISRSPKDQ